MSLIASQRCLLTSMRFQRVFMNNKRHLSLLFNRLSTTENKFRPMQFRYLSNETTKQTNINDEKTATNVNFSTASPLGKSSSEQHGGNNENTKSSSSSESREEQHASDEPFETVILKAAMKFVPEYGFTDEAISRG